MPRRFKNDPSNLPAEPNLVTDPARKAELFAEFNRKANYIVESYEWSVRLELGKADINRSIERLRKAINAPSAIKGPRERLNPFVEMMINIKARELGELAPDEPLRDEHGELIKQATAAVATSTRKLRGIPSDDLLRRHVEGLLALIQETTGKSYRAQRDVNSVYDPGLPGPGGEAIRAFVDRMKPGIPDTTLVFWLKSARSKFAGKPMRFDDLFPGYSMWYSPDSGAPEFAPPLKLESWGISIPIYCP